MIAPTRVMVVEDDAIQRRFLTNILKRVSSYCCTGSYSNGADALAHLLQDRPHILLLDHFMPKMNGIQCLLRVQLTLPMCKNVLMSGHLERGCADTLRELNADAYLIKPIPEKIILQTLELIIKGAHVIYDGDLQIIKHVDDTNVGRYFYDIWHHLEACRSPNERESLCLSVARAAQFRVSWLSYIVGMFKRQLNRKFIGVFQQTPQQWLGQYQMREALRLLEGGVSIKESASQLGYRHARNFSSRFARHFSSTPSTIANRTVTKIQSQDKNGAHSNYDVLE